jgi:hypothetical protein
MTPRTRTSTDLDGNVGEWKSGDVKIQHRKANSFVTDKTSSGLFALARSSFHLLGVGKRVYGTRTVLDRNPLKWVDRVSLLSQTLA